MDLENVSVIPDTESMKTDSYSASYSASYRTRSKTGKSLDFACGSFRTEKLAKRAILRGLEVYETSDILGWTITAEYAS